MDAHQRHVHGDAMSPTMERCLQRLADLREIYSADNAFTFATIGHGLGLDRPTIRRAVRALARRGLAEYLRGLTTEDGDFAGAGYRITDAGYKAACLIGAPDVPRGSDA